MKLVIASDNKGKLREFRELFRDFDVELLSKKEAGFTEEIDENGTTFAENARIKAETVMRATGLPALADDSGLCVDALGGAPGVYSARYTGNHNDTDEDRYRLLLKNMEGTADRRARFVCAMCCVFPNGDIISAHQTMEGFILYEPVGANGFGYDPIFQPEGCSVSSSQLTAEKKNDISHRGKAVREFMRKWEEYYDHK